MRTFFNRQVYAFFLLNVFFICTISSQQIESEIDQLVSSEYPNNEPGVSILVAKDGKPIYRKAFGMANLELNVPSIPENVYEIGSITKQFTAVAILMLQEQGKLSVDDDITKFIPDYPTQGNTITVHHLLNHTSGIKSYTAMESFINEARTDMTPTELIDVFKNEPMDFKTGEKFLYNNSGYILLGHIIEVVTGDTYENFIEKNIFEKLGMTSSYYGSNGELIKNRASGYKQDNNGYTNSDYLSMTLPYAAGSLMSTIDDLLKWQNAIRDNKIISSESLEKAINGSKLNSGEDIPYGYGWSKGNVQGSPGYAHGGGIFGYTTNGLYLKDEDFYIIGLTNCSCKNIGALTQKIAAVAIGKPYPNLKDTINLKEEQLKQWVGAYEFDEGVIRHITFKDGSLNSLREDANPQSFKLYPFSENRFLFEDVSIEYNFRKNAEGENEVIFVNSGKESIGKLIDKEPPVQKVAIALSSDILSTYIGTYELQPNFIIEVTVDGNQIFAQATGQPKFEIFPDSDDHFFVKVVPAQITFNKSEDGSIQSLTLHQGGQNMPAKKVD